MAGYDKSQRRGRCRTSTSSNTFSGLLTPLSGRKKVPGQARQGWKVKGREGLGFDGTETGTGTGKRGRNWGDIEHVGIGGKKKTLHEPSLGGCTRPSRK